MNSRVPYIVIDRTPFGDHETDFITVQHVPPSTYVASYPCWVSGKQSFFDTFRGRYKVVAQIDSSDGNAIAKGREFTFGGMILRKL